MKHYHSFNSIMQDKFLFGEPIVALNKLDGQNFGVKYNPRKKEFQTYCSKKRIVNETDEQFGNAVSIFKTKHYEDLKKILVNNSGKKGIFKGVEEITLYFEYYGENCFCGFHQETDELKLSLIDGLMYKKGFIEPRELYKLFDEVIEMPEIIYEGNLNQPFIDSIYNNDWTQEGCQYPTVKEGVVCKSPKLLKGQRLPMVKVKTKWWLDKLKEKHPTNWEELSKKNKTLSDNILELPEEDF